MRRSGLLVALVVVAACGGVLFKQANDFPCDFSQPPGVRDAVCSAGDVCGVNNVCQRFVYEGPRFEGPPTFPDFSADAGAGTRLHPLKLSEPLTTVAGDVGHNVVIARGVSGSLYAVEDGLVSLLPGPTPQPEATAALGDLGPGTARLAVVEDGGSVVLLPGGRTVGVTATPLVDFKAARIHAFSALEADGSPRPRLFAVARDGASAGEVEDLAGLIPRYTSFLAAPDVLDVGLAVRPGFNLPLVITRTSVSYQAPDGGSAFVPATAEVLDFGRAATLKTDPRSNVFAVLYDLPALGRSRPVALSTWQVSRTPSGLSIDKVWPDCAPCGDLAALPGANELLPVAFTPTFSGNGITIEVACASRQSVTLVRVTGSVAGVARQRCAVEPLSLPIDALHVAQGADGLPVQDATLAAAAVLGGSSGEVWSGDSLSQLQPVFLDRVPLDVALSPAGAVTALTDRYLASQQAAVEGANGFVRVPLRRGPGDELAVTALVHGSPGWGVASGGDLALLAPTGVTFGPQLVDGRGAPVQRPLAGEAITGLDGGLVSMLIAADDSLYLVPAGFNPADAPGAFDPLSPNLSPEPSTLIRSLALERTPIGTNGVDRVRGYVVTSRNLYAFSLAGAPPRWTSTPLVLTAGEPLEVWLDNPRGGLARVGYRDGQVYSLPGGFLLVDRLPAGVGAVPPQVQDYENLGGWPVALASTGLYAATYGVKPDGHLDNRFPDGGVNKPMEWTEISLPGGARPWMDDAGARARAGRLFVRAGAQAVATDGGFRQTFHLLLFLDDQVLEVGRHTRTNISAVTP